MCYVEVVFVEIVVVVDVVVLGSSTSHETGWCKCVEMVGIFERRACSFGDNNMFFTYFIDGVPSYDQL